MKLTYRGTTYDYTPPEVVYGERLGEGLYRGVPVGFYAASVPGLAMPVHDLVYRGVSYRTGADQVEATTVEPSLNAAAPTLSIADRMRYLAMGHLSHIRGREQSMLARLDETVGLTAADAAHYANRIQGKVSYDASQNYDRSHASMS
jgi:Domain of unknown function (DUF4278)